MFRPGQESVVTRPLPWIRSPVYKFSADERRLSVRVRLVDTVAYVNDNIILDVANPVDPGPEGNDEIHSHFVWPYYSLCRSFLADCYQSRLCADSPQALYDLFQLIFLGDWHENGAGIFHKWISFLATGELSNTLIPSTEMKQYFQRSH